MIKVLVIADDFTGALDTGVHFSMKGAKTLVSTQRNYLEENDTTDLDVLVIDTETRYVDFNEAYTVVSRITSFAQNMGIPYVYKKTDSALRGNVSAEIKALADQSNNIIPFIPAFPENGRTVEDGILYVNGQMVSESVFGKDPYEPVTESNIKIKLKQEANLESGVIHQINRSEEINQTENKAIYILDGTTEADLQNSFNDLEEHGLLQITIGNAGFGKVLANNLFSENNNKSMDNIEKLVVISGSINPVTKHQIEYSQEKGCARVSLSSTQLLSDSHWNTDKGEREISTYHDLLENHNLTIFETLSDETMDSIKKIQEQEHENRVRFIIGESLGLLTKKLWRNVQSNVTYLFTGGDTLYQVMKVLNINEISPISEVRSGVVLSRLQWEGKTIQVITKSGAFGKQSLFNEIIETSEKGEVIK